MHLAGWATFSGFMEVLHNVNMDSKFCLHTDEFGGQQSRNHVGNGEDIVHRNFL